MNIDNVFLINLDTRNDRLQAVKKEIAKSKILSSYKRISAIDGFTLTDTDLISLISPRAFADMAGMVKTGGLRMSYGAAGLASTYKQIFEKCDSNILLLEDDIAVDDDFDNVLTNAMNHAPKNWDIIYLSWYDSEKIVIENFNQYFNKLSGKINGTQAWIINKNSAQKLLRMFPITYQIDTEIYTNHKLNKYGIYKKIIHRIRSDSDIQVR